NGKRIEPPHGRIVPFASNQASGLAACVLNSSLFYWYYSGFADCEHINDGLVRSFPIPTDWERTDWGSLSSDLSESLKENARRMTSPRTAVVLSPSAAAWPELVLETVLREDTLSRQVREQHLNDAPIQMIA